MNSQLGYFVTLQRGEIQDLIKMSIPILKGVQVLNAFSNISKISTGNTLGDNASDLYAA